MSGFSSEASYFSTEALVNTLIRDAQGRRAFELPGAKPHYRPDRPGQVNHIALDLALDFDQRCFGGTCTITLTPVRDGLRSLVLDGVDLTIESVQIDGATVPHDHDGEKLIVNVADLETPLTVGTRVDLAIAYHVDNPAPGFVFCGTNGGLSQ